MNMDPIITSVTEQDPTTNEESLIDRDADVFDVEITSSPIFVSRRNLFNKVGRNISFLEVVQATIVPYVVEIYFMFPEFIGWCAEQYSHEERVVVNKQGSEVLCRVETLSIRESLSIPESFSTIYEPFNEDKLIRVYREWPSEVRDLFLQTIVKPENFSKSLSLPMNVNIKVIEVQWVCSLLSQVLGLDNEKYLVDVMLGFLLKFFKSEFGLSFYINFDQFLDDNIHTQLANFLYMRHFKYYTYLLIIFLETNKREFPEASFVSTECKRITILIFINKVMSRVYSFIFNTSLPRVLDDMRSYLQPNPENKVGDWVLFMHSIVI
jgi:hypothetical protein